MHGQLATYRRGGTERTRIPNYFIEDEASRYITPALEGWLSIAAEYRVAGIFALQTLGQLEVESGKLSARAMKRAIMASCRNKIAFGGLEYEDADEFSKIFGKEVIVKRMKTFEGGPIPHLFAKSYRDQEQEVPRFPSTFIMDGLPRFHFIHKLLKEGHPQVPGIAKGLFVPRDWKERLVEETKPLFDLRTVKQAIPWLKKRQQEARKKKVEAILQKDPFQTNEPANSIEEENRHLLEQFLLLNQKKVEAAAVEGGEKHEPNSNEVLSDVSTHSEQPLKPKQIVIPESPFDEPNKAVQKQEDIISFMSNPVVDKKAESMTQIQGTTTEKPKKKNESPKEDTPTAKRSTSSFWDRSN
ncbi:hypothetical protein EMIT07CA2_550170 [Brevibacillus sp. IT-7CA2]